MERPLPLVTTWCATGARARLDIRFSRLSRSFEKLLDYTALLEEIRVSGCVTDLAGGGGRELTWHN